MHLTLWLSLMALTALAGVALTRKKSAGPDPKAK